MDKNLEDISAEVQQLSEELHAVKDRNLRVDANKAWEVSRTRLFSIVFLLYFTMVFIFAALGSTRVWIDALIPTTGYLLSTVSLPFIRSIWESRR